VYIWTVTTHSGALVVLITFNMQIIFIKIKHEHKGSKNTTDSVCGVSDDECNMI